jgi:cold shock CspA family protein
MKGTITAYEDARGVGLITPEGGGPNVGFRVEDVDVPKSLNVGEPVIYAVEVGDWFANRVRILSAPRASRSRIVAALLAIFGGVLGLQKFYLGYPWIGMMILMLTLLFWWLALLPVLAAAGLGVIEGIIYLALSDEAFEQRYLKRRRAWL